VEEGHGEGGVVEKGREITEIARQRAIALVRESFGSIADLSTEVATTAWVTTFRACEIGVVAEQAGGVQGLVKNALVGDGTLKQSIVEWTLKLQFLNRMIPILRGQSDLRLKRQDSQILVDCLKWNIIDAGEMSPLRRMFLRRFAKADSLYKEAIPPELYE
jgi:hypothetical protein